MPDLSPARGERLDLPARRAHVTQKVRIGGRRTLYVTVHADPQPAEVFLRVKGADVTAETVALYDIVARLMSLALQYGAPMETVAGMLHGVKVEPGGPVTGHARIRLCTSLPDLIGRHLLVEWCGRADLAHTHGAPPEEDGDGRDDLAHRSGAPPGEDGDGEEGEEKQRRGEP